MVLNFFPEKKSMVPQANNVIGLSNFYCLLEVDFVVLLVKNRPMYLKCTYCAQNLPHHNYFVMSLSVDIATF